MDDEKTREESEVMKRIASLELRVSKLEELKETADRITALLNTELGRKVGRKFLSDLLTL